MLLRNARQLGANSNWNRLPIPRKIQKTPYDGKLTARPYSVQSNRGRYRSNYLWAIFGTATILSFVTGAVIGQKEVSGFQTLSKQPRIFFAKDQTAIAVARELQAVLGEDSVSFEEDNIESHGFSEWSSCNTQGRPVAIVYPKTTADVSKVAALCNENRVPIGEYAIQEAKAPKYMSTDGSLKVPFGAGSSVEGNFASPYKGIVVDLKFMDQIMSFHPDDMDVVVQPGVNWIDLNKEIQHENLFLPLDPSPTATVGGMVSTNCSGTNAFRYGTMKDWVINLTVVLANGQVIKTRRRPRKSSAGYNLTSLFVGAEGTLGIVTEVTLKLAVIPAETEVAVVSFPTISAAASAASKLIRSGISLAAVELMDETQMRIINRHGSESVRKIRWDESPSLFLKFSGPTRAAVKSDISKTRTIVDSYMPIKYFCARTKEEESNLWAARKEALWTMTSIMPEGHAIWSTDVAVPISRLAELVEMSKAEGEQLGIFNSVVGHVGDGNFHEAFMYDPKDPAVTEAVQKTIHRMMEHALEMEGTVSGEHAIGMGKMKYLVDELGQDTINVMKLLKSALDPCWIMNPGKVFELPGDSRIKPAPKQVGH